MLLQSKKSFTQIIWPSWQQGTGVRSADTADTLQSVRCGRMQPLQRATTAARSDAAATTRDAPTARSWTAVDLANSKALLIAIPYCAELEWRATCPRCAEQHTSGFQIECGGVRITQEEFVIKRQVRQALMQRRARDAKRIKVEVVAERAAAAAVAERPHPVPTRPPSPVRADIRPCSGLVFDT